jgi:hypothetical protein
MTIPQIAQRFHQSDCLKTGKSNKTAPEQAVHGGCMGISPRSIVSIIETRSTYGVALTLRRKIALIATHSKNAVAASGSIAGFSGHR